jgi:hypothetical protein
MWLRRAQFSADAPHMHPMMNQAMNGQYSSMISLTVWLTLLVDHTEVRGVDLAVVIAVALLVVI